MEAAIIFVALMAYLAVTSWIDYLEKRDRQDRIDGIKDRLSELRESDHWEA